eukprot:Tbor_TRINITY_DN5352_c2_g1::TRINITY_DN5352_c2_g1_i3::g.5127::m.5127
MGKLIYLSCCSVFAFTAATILFTFAAMMSGGDSSSNLTFLLKASKSGWNINEKSKACLYGGLIYTIFGMLCAVCRIVLPKVYNSKPVKKTPRLTSKRLCS